MQKREKKACLSFVYTPTLTPPTPLSPPSSKTAYRPILRLLRRNNRINRSGRNPCVSLPFIELSPSLRFHSPTENLQFLTTWVDKSETLMSYWIGHSEAQNCPVRLDIRFQYALDIQVTAYSRAKEPLLLTGYPCPKHLKKRRIIPLRFGYQMNRRAIPHGLDFRKRTPSYWIGHSRRTLSVLLDWTSFFQQNP